MLPHPPYLDDTDLTIFRRAEIPRDILRGPGFVNLEPVAFQAQTHLVLASWWEIPAGSAPMLDATLAQMAGFGRDVRGWLEVKPDCLGAGWRLCADHRYYFEPLADAVEQAFDKRKAKDKGAAARQRRRRLRDALAEIGADVAKLEAEVLDRAGAMLRERGAENLRGRDRADALQMIAVDLRILPSALDGAVDARLSFHQRGGPKSRSG